MIATVKILVQAARQMGIAVQKLDPENLVRFQKDSRSIIIYNTALPLNEAAACAISGNKALTSRILKKAGLAVQKYFPCRQAIQANKIAQKIGFPLVIKPNVGSKGRGVTAGIKRQEELSEAIRKAFSWCRRIALCPFYPGEDYRLLVLDKKVIGAIKRTPPTITGDGQTRIKALIKQENQKRKAFNQKAGFRIYKQIEIDEEITGRLQAENLKINETLKKGRVLQLRSVSNCSQGGLAATIGRNEIHPQIAASAIQAAALIGLRLAAVDLILKDHRQPLTEANGAIIEINSKPGFSIHHYPFSGQPQDIASPVLKALFNPLQNQT